MLTFSLLALGALLLGMVTDGSSTWMLFSVYRSPLTQLTAFASGLVQFIFFPGTALLGASGIVFMMIVLSSLSGMRDGAIPLTLILVVVLYLGGEVVDAVSSQDDVSQLTHIVGGLCGGAFGLTVGRTHGKRK